MRPRKDKWSVAEILAHLAEDEIATAWRYRQMVEHSASRWSYFVCFALLTCNFYESCPLSSGNVSASMPSEAGSPCETWLLIWSATTRTTSNRSAT